MLKLSTTAPVELAIPGSEDDPAAPRFLMRVPGVTARAMFEAELAAPPYNAARVSDGQLYDALSDAVREWNADDAEALSYCLGLLQRAAAGDALAAEERQAVLRLEEMALEHWPAYAALRRRRSNRVVFAPLLALRHFLAGWRNVPAEFSLGRDGLVSEETLSALAEGDRQAIGFLLLRELYLSGAEGEHLRSPLPASRDRKTSKAAGARPTAARGRSARGNTGKIHA